MTLTKLVREHLVEVALFLDELEKIEDEGDREKEYRSISKLVRFVQRFYEKFLAQEYGVEINSFTFEDKHIVAEAILKTEEKDTHSEAEELSLALSYTYLELCDQMHDELAFGYATDTEDFMEFHRETFPDWLDELSAWLKEADDEELGEEVEVLSRRYRRAA